MIGLNDLLQAQKAFFYTGETRHLAFRLEQLKKLENLILENERLILEALKADLGKSEFEAFSSEIAILIDEIRFARKNLASWMKPKRVKTPLHLQPGVSEIHLEPRGVGLIISPWNYPFQLAIAPLIASIAAGNCAIIKPSELVPKTSALIHFLISKNFPSNYIVAVEGGVSETTELLALHFDHIFFTGSPGVGRIVMQAAARNLTPVTLELGGKSPAVVTSKSDLNLAAKRIVWGKFLNSGQTCVAPDYVYVQSQVADGFLENVRRCIKDFYGSDPRSSASYSRIVNLRNFDRLEKLIQAGKIFHGGERDRESLFIAPTILTDVSWSDAVMQDEIFGPILPVLKFENFEEVQEAIRKNPKPLAAYIFSEDRKETDLFLQLAAFGGGCVNDTVIHLTNPHLPFGGVGTSGIGSYHGEIGFKTLSHQKSIIRRTRWMDLSFRYPPYDQRKLYWIKKVFGIR